MFTSFWESLGSKFAERWAGVLTPVLFFWAGGLAAWTWGHGGVGAWKRIEDWITHRSTAQQVIIAAGLVLVLTISVVLVRRLTPTTTRLLEGYWPRPLMPLWRVMVNWNTARLRKYEQRWLALADGLETRSAQEKNEFERLDLRLRRIPVIEGSRMPTRLGNIRRAAEGVTVDKYGLEPEQCLPRLWLVLPEAVKQDLTRARNNLDVAAGVWLCGIFFAIWTMWAWWALPLAATVSYCAYLMMPGAAATYGDLVESTFDVHRKALYDALRWPLPANPREERETGAAITQYLWRGSDQLQPEFKPREEDEASLAAIAIEAVNQKQRTELAERARSQAEADLEEAQRARIDAEQRAQRAEEALQAANRDPSGQHRPAAV